MIFIATCFLKFSELDRLDHSKRNPLSEEISLKDEYPSSSTETLGRVGKND